jgi:aspartate aminotransferase
VQEVPASETFAIKAKVDELRREGKNPIDFSIGQPDFDIPESAEEGGIAAFKQGFTKYTEVSGIKELKEAICEEYKRMGMKYEPSQVIVSNGAKHSLDNIWRAIIDPGDEVIVPVPYWVSYCAQIRLSDGIPVFVNTDKDFQLDPDAVEKRVTKKTKAILLNTPNNPSGAVYSKEAIEGIADIAIEHDLCVVSDDVYRYFLYDGNEHYNIASLDGMKEKTILVDAASKTFAATGLRIGYTLGPVGVSRAISNMQGQTASNPCSISQKAILAALADYEASEQFIDKMVREFNKRREYMWKRLNEMGIECEKPGGAFYIFPDTSKFYNSKVKTSTDFVNYLLDDVAVALVPGSSFGMDKNVRFSYATSIENIEEGMNRIEKAIRTLG